MEEQNRKPLHYSGEAGQFKYRILFNGEIGGILRKFLLLSFFLISVTISLFSHGIREEKNNAGNSIENTEAAGTIDGGKDSGISMKNTVKITGMVQIYGNEPHTFAGIAGENGEEYAIYPPSCEDELRTLQGRLIDFTVIILDEPKGYGGLFLRGGTVTPVEWRIIR
jgi:hypothetical protein